MKIVVATRNEGKIRELTQLLNDLPVELISAATAHLPEVDETGATFEDNARLKAISARAHTGLNALGEDSGIEVDALGGAPGIYSSRFAGPDATDEDRNQELMAQMEGVPEAERTCRYRSVVVLALNDGREIVCEGTCEGRITREAKGENGFGYDPIFFLPDRNRTIAQLTPDEKNRISHRGQTLTHLNRELSRLVTEEI